MASEHMKERLIGATGSISGAASILGSWQVCHSICLGLIALLGVIGITLTGMPLLFFTKIAVPLWLIAVVLMGIVLYFFFTKHCISRNLILINSGLIIAGTPFEQLRFFQIGFWSIGGVLVLTGISLAVRDKVRKRRERCCHA